MREREDDVATGASSDLEQATRIARAMVYSLGMNGVCLMGA